MPGREVHLKVTSILKDGVNDPEGNTIKDALHVLGFDNVISVRVGKAVEFDVSEDTVEKIKENLEDKKTADFPGLGSRILNTYSLAVESEKKKPKAKKRNK